jgi:hypothetical protein
MLPGYITIGGETTGLAAGYPAGIGPVTINGTVPILATFSAIMEVGDTDVPIPADAQAALWIPPTSFDATDFRLRTASGDTGSLLSLTNGGVFPLNSITSQLIFSTDVASTTPLTVIFV